MRPITLVVLQILSSATGPVLAGGPGGPSNTKSAPAGPDKLSQCGCGPITDKMAQCQSVKGINDHIRDCVCIPNDQPDGWYGYLHSCRACLRSDNGDDDAAQTFFGNLASTITQLFVSCTEIGGGVVSDGTSICASNAMFEACAALNAGRDSWASFERDGETSNGTYSLNVDVAGGKGDGGDDDDDKTESSSSSRLIPTSLPSATQSSSPTKLTSSSAEITPPAQTGIGSGTVNANPTSTSVANLSYTILTVSPDSYMGAIVAVIAAFTAGLAWL